VFDAERDDTYRALGRYVVEFSRLLWWMRKMVAEKIGNRELVELTLGEVTASPIASAFFAICKHSAPFEFDDDEQAIARTLSNAVADEITRRNDYTHGDWWIGWGNEESGMSEPQLVRTKPTRKEGPVRTDLLAASTIELAAVRLVELRNLVGEFGFVCLQQWMYDPLTGLTPGQIIRVRDVFAVEGTGAGRRVIRRPDAQGDVRLA
jgi:hypothetical protein